MNCQSRKKLHRYHLKQSLYKSYKLFNIDTEWESSEVGDSKIDEFEKWKQSQKELSQNKIPLDEAPPRDVQQDEVITIMITNF